jgi:hypothetical protein
MLGAHSGVNHPRKVRWHNNLSPKSTSLQQIPSFEPLRVKIGRQARPGREEKKKGKGVGIQVHILRIWGVPSIEAISTKLAIFVEYQDIIKFFKI